MSIKLRLILSYVAMLIIPFVLIIVLRNIFMSYIEGNKIEFVRENAALAIIYVLFILTFTNGILTYLVSKSIIKPLKQLEKAANEIKNGNLDYKISACSKDEIGDVCVAFEEMRTRLKESLAIQQQYEENRKELISNISHDLKTPITSIKGYIEGIRDGVADTHDKMNKYINTIYTKANYMDNLIDDLFLFSRLDLNRVPFDFQAVDIGSYIKNCAEEFNFDFDRENIELTSNIPEKPIMVKADLQKLKRVIMNIVDNSIKYKGIGRLKISISVQDKDDDAMIIVKDNGKGIPKEALPYVFDRFFRADASRETTRGGSGLGLAIVKRIIEEHGGRIWVESEINEGTAIFFTLKKHTKEVR